MPTKKVLVEIITALLILLFLHTAVSKFLNFKDFWFDMKNQPFPDSLTPILVWAVPLSEISIVALLLFERTRISGLYGSLVLMSLFTLYTALVLLHFFDYVPCSCGGVVKYLSWSQHLVFNLFFVVISFIGIRLSKQQNAKNFNQLNKSVL